MKREILQFPNTTIEVVSTDNVIYLHVSGEYTDEVALKVIQYLEPLIDQIPGNPIRIWDGSDIPAGALNLSSQCIEILAQWAKHIQAKQPGALAYLIAPTEISFGMSRMYGIRANSETTSVVVLHAISELPEEIRKKLHL